MVDTESELLVMIRFPVIYTEVEGGWTQASLEHIPGVITAAPSRQGAHDLLHDALVEYIASGKAQEDAQS